MAGENESGDTGLNIDETVASIATDLGLSEKPETEKEDVIEEVIDETVEKTKAEDTAEVKSDAEVKTDSEIKPDAPVVKAPPKSWAKEHHERWGKIDKDTQDYIELREKQMLDGLEQYKGDSGFGKQLREVLTPYQPILKAQGLNEAQAVQTLLNAHYRLTQGGTEQRAAAYRELGKNLGLVQDDGTEAKIDPTVRALQEKISSIESTITTSRQAELEQHRARVSKEVEAFASDPKHPYFDDVADDIVAMLSTGASLEDAYGKAVWANPVTRQKEIARLQTEQTAELQKKAKTEAEIAKKAASTNVRGRDTRRTPTEPKGTMEDTMNDTLREIRSRAH